LSSFDFSSLRASNAPVPTELPGTKSELPPYPFVMSYPDPSILPIMDIHEAMGEVLEQVCKTPSVYPDTQGYPPLREYIVQRLAMKRDMSCKPDEVLLTEGSGQAIHFVTEALVEPGDVVIVDDFVYGGTLWSLNRFKADIRGVTSDSEGMIPEQLERIIDQAESDGKKPKFIYLIPTFQNPQAWTMTLKRRKEIIAVARYKRVPILEDDGIAEFRFEGNHIPSMQSLDDSGLVIHTGTFSKIIAPGMRIGYLIASKQLLETVMPIKGSRGVTQFGALTVHRFATTRLDNHLLNLNKVLRSRRNAMLESLSTYFSDLATWSIPEGGLYTWINMESGIDLVDASIPAAKEGVIYDLGTKFATGKDPGRNKARLCFSYNNEEDIDEGIKRLSKVVRTTP